MYIVKSPYVVHLFSRISTANNQSQRVFMQAQAFHKTYHSVIMVQVNKLFLSVSSICMCTLFQACDVCTFVWMHAFVWVHALCVCIVCKVCMCIFVCLCGLYFETELILSSLLIFLLRFKLNDLLNLSGKSLKMI